MKECAPDAGELDHRRAAADDGEVADRAMAGEHDVVGEDDVVADVAVVADVRVGEEGAAVADRRLTCRRPRCRGSCVTPSRIMQSAPTLSVDGSPLYLRSCG